jgi:predicted amidohydrolase YtcJ
VTKSVLLRGGSVYSPADPFATAMLVVDDRIAWVGQEGAADTHADDADQVVQLDGALVAPAFVDAHVHVLGTALGEFGVDAAAATSVGDLMDRIAAYARTRPGDPIGGQGWDEHNWPEARVPSLDEIDRAAGGAPMLLSRVDGHSSLISTALLDRDPSIADAAGFEGVIVRRDAQTRARNAMHSSISDGQRRDLHRAVLRRAASLGIGSVHEMAAPHITSPEDVSALLQLAATEPLPDVVAYWGETGAGVERARQIGARGAAGDLTLDGSIGSHSAALAEPYADLPSGTGALYLDLVAATAHVVTCTRAGIQAGFHCIGDEAVRIAVRAIGRAADVCGLAEVVGARHRLEHVEMVDDELIPELARLGVVASVQPAFDAFWGGPDGLYTTRLGAQRAARMNPFAALARAGVTLAFGSDTPVTPLGGWEGVRAAAYHHTPAHRMSVRGAFSAATRGGWRAANIDDAGTLVPGALATYAIWDVPGELVVQAPDERVSAWSTDPRSGVPGLPDLSPGTPPPTCQRTVVRGDVAFDKRDTPSVSNLL